MLDKKGASHVSMFEFCPHVFLALGFFSQSSLSRL